MSNLHCHTLIEKTSTALLLTCLSSRRVEGNSFSNKILTFMIYCRRFFSMHFTLLLFFNFSPFKSFPVTKKLSYLVPL